MQQWIFYCQTRMRPNWSKFENQRPVHLYMKFCWLSSFLTIFAKMTIFWWLHLKRFKTFSRSAGINCEHRSGWAKISYIQACVTKFKCAPYHYISTTLQKKTFARERSQNRNLQFCDITHTKCYKKWSQMYIFITLQPNSMP